jgi:hypothetical protein
LGRKLESSVEVIPPVAGQRIERPEDFMGVD